MPGWINRVLRAFEFTNRSPNAIDIARREALYAAAVQSSNLAFLTLDTNGIINGWNKGAEKLFGYSADEVIGQEVEILIPEDRRAEMAMAREKLKIHERIDSLATVRLAKSGKRIEVVLNVSPLMSAAGELLGSSAIVRDATEQRLAEDLFALAVEACPSGMMMTDRSGKIVMVNSEIERLFGYAREELLNQSIEMLVPHGMRGGHVRMRADFAKRPHNGTMGRNRELYGLRKDGSEVPLEIRLNATKIRDELFVLAVIVDVTERRRAEQLKDEFVATVSHELRTPLTSITASLALLLTGKVALLSEPASRLVAIAHSNGQRLVRLVNDILDIEKMESGKMVFNLAEVNTLALVEQAIETSRAYANEFGVTIRLDPESVAGEARADPDRLAQVVSNLVSNAIKFSPRGEEVVIAVGKRDGVTRITVRDHGVGIPEEFKARVFSKFAQADGSDSKQKGGSGLGLSIVKQIVDQMGGEVGFESAPGQGTLFFVEMPRRQPASHAEPAPPARNNQIMLCEDDADVAEMLSIKLLAAGFEAHVAPTVSEALRKAESFPYSAILVDLNLPDGDGLSLIEQLRSRPEYHDKPIIVISANSRIGRSDLRAFALKVLDWLDKPVDLDRLLHLLDRSITRADGDHGVPLVPSDTHENQKEVA